MIFAVLGALVVGLSLGLFGSGGSILTVPVLRYVLHHPEKLAIAESLAIVGAIAAIGAAGYARARLVSWAIALLFGAPGMAGAYLGALAGRFVPGFAQLMLLAVVMMFAAWKMSRARPAAGALASAPGIARDAGGRIVLRGFAVGVLTGLVGVGGGFLIVPALTLLADLDVRRAIGTSLLIIALQAGVGFIEHWHALAATGLQPSARTIALFVGVGAIGSASGRWLGTRVSPTALRSGFALLLAVVAFMIVLWEAVAIASAGWR